MAIKELQTRIALKYDSYSAWTSAPGKDLVLLAGELGICYVGDANQGSQVVPTVLFKVGNGTSTFEQLPWASAKAADVYSWAKSETVVLDGTTLKFKTGDAVNHTVDLSSFATDTEVEAIRSALDARIEALEGKFDGENSVQGQLNALDGRLDAIEGENGLIAQAEKAAKDYTDTREAAITSAYEAYANQAEADAKKDAADKLAAAVETLEAADEALGGRLDVIEGEGEGSVKKALADAKSYADQAELDAVASAKSYTDGRETAITTAYQAYADQAEADAKKYADDELAAAVGTINAKDAAQDTAIQNNTTAISNEVTARENADKAINDKIGGNFDATNTVAKAIADAQDAAEANAAADAAAKVKELKEGDVATNAAAIQQLITDLGTEKTNRENADTALDERLDRVEAFFAGADHDGIDNGIKDALDTLVEVQNFLSGEGSEVGQILDALDEQGKAIDALEDEFAAGGRVTVAEKDIDDLQAAVATKLATETFNTWKGTHEEGHAKSAAEITSEIGTAVSGEKTEREAADKAINDKIGGSFSASSTVASAIEAAQSAGDNAGSEASRAHSRLDTAEPKIATLQDLVDGYTGKGSILADVDAAQKAADDAQDAADKAQGEVDALEGVVATLRGEYDVTKALATTNEAAISALDTRVGIAEGDIDDLEAEVFTGADSNANLRSAITDLQTLTGDASKGNEALRSELTTLQGVVNHTTTGLAATKAIADEAKSDAEDAQSRVAKIEADYLKEADLFIINCGSSTKVTHTSETSEA
jgi:predicted  nucleic acid-binding Zn-ribbon protein